MIISAIIPTHNQAKYLSRCLASLQKQNLDVNDQLEIIVIDAGSTDKTIERVKRLRQIKLVHQEQRTRAIAANQGAKLARGDVLVFVQANMEFDADFIKHLIKPIKSKQAKGTFSKEEFIANWENVWARCWNWNQNLPAKRALPLYFPDQGNQFMAILKTEFQRVDGFDNNGLNEPDMLVKKLTYKPIHAPGAVFYHYNPETLLRVLYQARKMASYENKLKFIKKIILLIQSSFPVSMGMGFYKSIKYKEPLFLLFKPINDLGVSIGIIESLFNEKVIN